MAPRWTGIVSGDAALEDLRSVEVADVLKGEAHAGRLAREGDDVVFRYLPEYRDEPVARTLPLSAEPYRASAGAVPPFFAGLLPEGLRLTATVRRTRTSEDDHLTLLLAVGGDAIGDVRVVPADGGREAPSAALDEEQAGDIDLRDVFTRATSLTGDTFERIALPGVQPKVSAVMVSTPVQAGTGPAILKLNPVSGYPRLVENEDFFLRMAAGCGLPVPRHRLLQDRAGRSGLLVARFDRARGSGGALRRLSQEDACQLLGAYPAAKYRVRTEQVARALADAVEDGDGSRPLALRRVLELVAFSYLIGNGDLHAKNFSAYQTDRGHWSVTPAYDLVCTQPYLSWRDPMALDLYGRANRMTRAHLVESGQRLGLPARAAAQALDRLCDAAPDWADRVGEIGLDDRATERLRGLIRQRLAELRGEGRAG